MSLTFFNVTPDSAGIFFLSKSGNILRPTLRVPE
jgi:hypothetical protein